MSFAIRWLGENGQISSIMAGLWVDLAGSITFAAAPLETNQVWEAQTRSWQGTKKLTPIFELVLSN
jgi:hypothetical protein